MGEPSASENKAFRLVVHGRVQGVGFRYWTVSTASKFRINGWVKNEYDGSVTVVCEGPASSVDAFLSRLKQGPPGARVDAVDVSPLRCQGTYRGFTIEF